MKVSWTSQNRLPEIGSAPSAGGAGFGINDDIGLLDEIFFQSRVKTENARCGVTAGVGHKARLGYGVGIELRQAVISFGQGVGFVVIYFVPLLIDILSRKR